MTAPMPGKVLEILCSVGDEVEVGQTLIVMEAMKMEHRIAANGPGTIVAIHHEVGEQVDAGAILIDIEEIE
jgi:propionyl-CoA carboxylase alpha chain